jgi:nuclear cap-binding protein subunit 1
VLRAGGLEDGGRGWQPYTDHVVYCALMALPWGGPELAEGAPAETARIFAAVEAYMGARARQSQPALAPFSARRDEKDTAAASDSGGASFLGQVLRACAPSDPSLPLTGHPLAACQRGEP